MKKAIGWTLVIIAGFMALLGFHFFAEHSEEKKTTKAYIDDNLAKAREIKKQINDAKKNLNDTEDGPEKGNDSQI